MIDEADLRRLSAGRWLAPLMALLDQRQGARFAEMLAALGLSRGVLSASLDQLQRAGWIRRNPGHGHPLRPEYVLTAAGPPIAAFSTRLMAARARLGLGPGDVTRWTLPLIAALGHGAARFSELRAVLAPVTPRALSLTLKQAVAAGLVGRALEDSFPPTAIYALSDRGRSLAAALSESIPRSG